jgi:hypothetical protein
LEDDGVPAEAEAVPGVESDSGESVPDDVAPRRVLAPRWIGVVAVVVGVALLASLFGLGILDLPLGSNGPHTSANQGPIDIATENWTGQNATVTSPCSVCDVVVQPGAEFNVSLQATSACTEFGCSGNLTGVSIQPPFLLLGTDPSLPTPTTAGVPVALHVSIRAPSTGGTVTLVGAVVGSSIPGPLLITKTSWQVTYAGNTSGYLSVSDRPSNTTLLPGTEFEDAVNISSHSPYLELVTSLGVSLPFSEPGGQSLGLPAYIPPMGHLSKTVLLQAPASRGSVTLQGNVGAGPSPMVKIGLVSIETNITYDPYVQLPIGNLTGPTEVRPGATFTLIVYVNNTDTASHEFEFTGIQGNYTLVTATPLGLVTIPAGVTQFWYITVRAPVALGTYNLNIGFDNPG